MRTINYAEEQYFLCDENLHSALEGYCTELISRMQNNSFMVSEILKHKKRRFENCWDNLEHNNPNHPHVGNEITGLYAFAKKENNNIDWQYIGISRTIKRRFQGHTVRKTKSSATLAHLIAKELKKKKNTEGIAENEIASIQQEYIHPCYFTFIKIKDNMLLHIAEVYCVNKLKSEWNSFKTH